MASLGRMREKLNHAQAVFCRSADTIRTEQWAQQPGPEQWSAAEVVAHLVVVERGIVAKAGSIVQKTPRQIPLIQRWHLPMRLLEMRVVKRKSPVAQDPALLGEKEAMLAALRVARANTIAFLEETEQRDLSVYRWKHPFLGMLSLYGWIEMIAGHQIRHAKQVQEIGQKISRK